MEIFMHPWVFDLQHLLHCAGDQDAFFGQDGNTITNRVQRIKIMRHQKDRQSK